MRKKTRVFVHFLTLSRDFRFQTPLPYKFGACDTNRQDIYILLFSVILF